MLLDMHPLLCGDTNRLAFEYPLDLSDPVDLPGITYTAPAAVFGFVSDSAGYMEMTATVRIEYDTVCDRCLAPLHRTAEISFTRAVAEESSLVDSETDDYVLFSGTELDTDPPVIEQVILDFPAYHLCREDCLGLCPKCGADLNVSPCSCVTREVDPRLAVLKKLLEQ